ncbi:hypothetical protein L9F63_003378 [Diploptera punctata]|uniref:TIR domain-containing protein n=1 Tax=Diploptera punctata TaxID=6984 RepID=A0AAD7ZK65_DIPPU|nr:hypothetical protein L9F63_003378 [Diploptera punctata]
MGCTAVCLLIVIIVFPSTIWAQEYDIDLSLVRNQVKKYLMVEKNGSEIIQYDSKEQNEEEEEDDVIDLNYCKNYNLQYIIDDAENLTELMKTNKISNIRSIPRINLTRCVFEESSEDIICEFIAIGYDYRPFLWYDFFLRVVFVFKLMNESETGCDEVCLVKLTSVNTQKVDGSYTWNNGTKQFLGPTFMIYLLHGMQGMNWESYFTADVAIGILYKKTDCTGQRGMKTSCINRLEIINFTKILKYGLYAYCSEFWEAFRLITLKTMAGVNSSLTLKSHSEAQEHFFLFYVQQMLNSTGLNSLTLNNFDLKNVSTILQNMTLLRYLDLSNNNIDHHKAGNLKQSRNVEYLDMSFNNLEQIPQQISLLYKLKYLDISSNPIKYINPKSNNILSRLNNLQWLLMSHTYLNSLDILQDLLTVGNSSVLLKGLDVSYCNISSLQYTNFFLNQPLLQDINLSGNELHFIPSKLFYHLKYLKIIHISDISLTHAPKLELGLNKTMEMIDLSRNKLISPEEILVSGKVLYLDLSFNVIEEWFDEAIFSVGTCMERCTSNSTKVWVQNLNISYNLMPTITKVMANSLSELEVVDIGENPFSCSHCEVVEFAEWVRQVQDNSTRVKVVYLGEDNLKCKVDASGNSSLLRDIVNLPEVCLTGSYWITVGSIIGTFLLLCLLMAVMVVRYKFEMAYVMFMMKQKRKWKSLEHKGGFEYDAFVCYSRHDRSWVMQEMVPTLEECAEKYKLCLHERDFILGSFISCNIVQSIQKSRFTVLVLSNHFIHSQWCRWELEVANHKLFESGREFLILIQLETLNEETLPRHLKFLMDTRTYLEWPQQGEDTATAWKRLRKNLGKSIHQQLEAEQELEQSFQLSTSRDNLF